MGKGDVLGGSNRPTNGEGRINSPVGKSSSSIAPMCHFLSDKQGRTQQLFRRKASADVFPRVGSGQQRRKYLHLPQTVNGLSPLCYPEMRSEEHTSELQSLMRISYSVLCLKKKK